MSVRIGLVVPCDLTLDREYWDLAPDDVSIHITRTGFHDGGLTSRSCAASPTSASSRTPRGASPRSSRR